ncbi:hypothetical protein L210DRAFT_1061348 [Boletus edulis BED1]|uniref:Galactose oxidase n=1 Tax=Boletus edulis BED1 TaxID=1328754 RepID=A0AAD4BPA8_BOLED|nr:hypothetical protein L210DRAFT_1061348 [Boletus edulis BED1]
MSSPALAQNPASSALYDPHQHYIQLADAPAQPRGGAAIASVTLTPDFELVLIRSGGFAGFQLPRSTSTRSAPKLVYPPPTLNTASGSPLKRDASSVGHAGADVFWDDAWVLLVMSTPTSTSPSLEWKNVEGTDLHEPRGWFPPASYIRDGKTRVVLTGGLLSSNERSRRPSTPYKYKEKNATLTVYG